VGEDFFMQLEVRPVGGSTSKDDTAFCSVGEWGIVVLDIVFVGI
jgi:hypothetical protein